MRLLSPASHRRSEARTQSQTQPWDCDAWLAAVPIDALRSRRDARERAFEQGLRQMSSSPNRVMQLIARTAGALTIVAIAATSSPPAVGYHNAPPSFDAPSYVQIRTIAAALRPLRRIVVHLSHSITHHRSHPREG